MGKELTTESEQMSNWQADRKLVMHVVRENTEAIKELSSKIDSLATKHDKRITAIEIKSGLFGTMGGALSFLLVFAFQWLSGKMKI